MTRQKTFKRRVRERMERTGESYATARAQLTGSDSALPCGGLHPHCAALRVALADAGIAVSEELVLLMTGGAGAAAMAFRYEAEDFTSFYLSGWNPFQSDIRDAVRRLGLEADIHETTGAATAAKALRDRLATGHVQVAWVERAALRGSDPSPHSAPHGDADGVRGSDPFGRVVEGYDAVAVLAVDGDEVVIADLSPRPVRVPAARFAAARGRIRRDRHRLLAIGAGEPDVAAAVRAGLERCAAGPERPPAPGMSLEGIKRWADRLHGTRGREGWARMFPPGRHRAGALRATHAGIAAAGGGLMRPMQARGLREAATLLDLPALDELADRTDALGRGWTALGEAAAATDPADTGDTVLEDFQARVRELYAEELATRERLAAVL